MALVPRTFSWQPTQILVLLCSLFFVGEADCANVRTTLRDNPDGVKSTAFPCVLTDRSDCAPPTTGTLTCDDSAAPSLIGLVTGNAYSADVRLYFAGTAAATATLSVFTASGDDATAEGWAISSAGAGNNLTHNGTGTGAGALKVRGTTGGNSIDCAVRPWSYIDDPAADSTAPTFPTGLVMTPGTNSCTFEFDASADPYAGEAGSGIDEFDLRCGSTVVHTLTGQTSGLSKQFTLTNIGTSTPAPSGNQTGASWDLSGGGAGFQGTTNQFPFWHASVPGSFSLSAKVTAFAPTVQAFSGAGVIVMESAVAGSKLFACYKQESDHSVQCKARTATDGAAANVATISGITGDAWVRISGGSNTWTGEYSINGNDWLPIVTNYANLSMPATVEAGFFITSRTDGSAVTATLQNLNLNNVSRISYTYSTGSACLGSVRARDNDNNNSVYSAAVSCTPATPPSEAVKWHPGHYMLTPSRTTTAALPGYTTSHITGISAEANIKGVYHRTSWAVLEPTRGNYDFSTVDTLLALCQSVGKRLILQIYDNNAGNTSAPLSQTLPVYLATEASGGGGWETDANGRSTANRHRASINDRMIALMQAMAQHTVAGTAYTLDTHPYFEGVAWSETSAATNGALADGFTRADLATQTKRWMQEVKSYWPHTNVIYDINYLSNEIEGLVAAALQYKIAMGGPDTVPSAPTAGQRVFQGLRENGAAGGIDYRGDLPAFFQVQGPELAGKEGTFTMTQLGNAAATYGASHEAWLRTGQAPPKPNWTNDILPYLQGSPATLTTSCPSAYASCDTN